MTLEELVKKNLDNAAKCIGSDAAMDAAEVFVANAAAICEAATYRKCGTEYEVKSCQMPCTHPGCLMYHARKETDAALAEIKP